MSGWGIADTASKIEKIKAESADYLHGLDSCGKIEWSTYSDAFDFYADLIEKAYAQGKEDAQSEIIRCKDCKHRGEKPIADGRYWCELLGTFMYYCSDAERRTDDSISD